MSDLIQEPRSWVGHEHSGYRHDIQIMPGRVKVGRYLALLALAAFCVLLWRAGS